MPIEVVLPALSAGMEDAVIAKWLKAEGETVTKGDLLAEVETDKATMELDRRPTARLGVFWSAMASAPMSIRPSRCSWVRGRMPVPLPVRSRRRSPRHRWRLLPPSFR